MRVITRLIFPAFELCLPEKTKRLEDQATDADSVDTDNGSSQMIVHCDDGPQEFEIFRFWLGGAAPQTPRVSGCGGKAVLRGTALTPKDFAILS